MKTSRFTPFLIFLGAIAIGCQSTRYTFRHVETRSEEVSLKQEIVRPTISFLGIDNRKANPWLRFEVELKNVGKKSVVVQPGRYELLDDENRRLSPKVEEGDDPDLSYQIAPKTVFKATLTFEFPRHYDFKKVGSLRLLWNYRVEERTHRYWTQFVKHTV